LLQLFRLAAVGRKGTTSTITEEGGTLKRSTDNFREFLVYMQDTM